MRQVSYEIKGYSPQFIATEGNLLIIHNDFIAANGAAYRFRRAHRSQLWDGVPGILAITEIRDFSIVPLRFLTANDLSVFSENDLALGLAFYPMPRSSAEDRNQVAQSLNDFWGVADAA